MATFSCNLGENVTGIGYQFFDAAGLIGARVTAGISNPRVGVYYATADAPVGAAGIYWNNTGDTIFAEEVFEGAQEGLDPAVEAALNAAVQVVLVQPYVPSTAPAVIIPAPPTDPSLCLVYGYAITADGSRAPGARVTLALSATLPAKLGTGQIIQNRAVSATADANGFLSATVLRGYGWRVEAPDLTLHGLSFTSSGATFDIGSLVT